MDRGINLLLTEVIVIGRRWSQMGRRMNTGHFPRLHEDETRWVRTCVDLFSGCNCDSGLHQNKRQ